MDLNNAIMMYVRSLIVIDHELSIIEGYMWEIIYPSIIDTVRIIEMSSTNMDLFKKTVESLICITRNKLQRMNALHHLDTLRTLKFSYITVKGRNVVNTLDDSYFKDNFGMKDGMFDDTNETLRLSVLLLLLERSLVEPRAIVATNADLRYYGCPTNEDPNVIYDYFFAYDGFRDVPFDRHNKDNEYGLFSTHATLDCSDGTQVEYSLDEYLKTVASKWDGVDSSLRYYLYSHEVAYDSYEEVKVNE